MSTGLRKAQCTALGLPFFEGDFEQDLSYFMAEPLVAQADF